MWWMVELEGWMRALRKIVAVSIGLGALVLLAHPASAAVNHKHSHAAVKHQQKTEAQPFKGELVEDADSGRVLYELNADMPWPPASMAKMMLLLVASDQIKNGSVGAKDPVRISERAAHTGGSRVGLVEGQIYPLDELMKAALIKSANDAAVAVAEKVGGSVEGTVRMMNARARGLGMTHTVYNTVDGLPPRPAHDVDQTSARDLATVARAIITQTDLLKWSGLEEAEFDGGVCVLHNTNHLIGHFDGCDGLKTGFTFQAGFNLTATAKRGNMRLISVVLGAPSNAQRFAQTAKLLEWSFEHFTAVPLLKPGESLPVQVQAENGLTIQPIVARELKVVLPREDAAGVKLEYRVPNSVAGPVKAGEQLGLVVVHDRDGVVAEAAALSPIAIGLPSDGLPSPAAAAAADAGWNATRPTAYNQPPQSQEPQ
jgi:serine-type D-Ala-D-Ala carboxypeptidase (penicillin-binding protein 5/6)